MGSRRPCTSRLATSPNVEVRPFGHESVYDIVWATTVVIEEGALENAAGVPAEERRRSSDA
jgi:ribosomal protein L4